MSAVVRGMVAGAFLVPLAGLGMEPPPMEALPSEPIVADSRSTESNTSDVPQLRPLPDQALTGSATPNIESESLPLTIDEEAEKRNSPLLFAWRRAQLNDPGYLAAQADRDLALLQSKAAFAAIFPEFRFGRVQLETENSTRTTMSISQPIFNIDRYVAFKESYPREALAYAQFTVKQYDLVTRLLKAVADVIRSNELLELNAVKITTLEQQARGAQRLYQLGVGTLTDERETAVRLSQAKAERLSLVSRQLNAEKTLQGIVGPYVQRDDFRLGESTPAFRLSALADYMARALATNPQLVIAQQNQVIADLGITKANGMFLPQVSANFTQSERNMRTSNNSGISITYPLGANNYYARSIAQATYTAAEQQVRQQEQLTRLNAEKFYGAVVSGLEEVKARKDAITAAELSLEGNEKSFKGGIRSRTDVLNSIQSLFQIREQYMESVLTLADNFLSLRLSAVDDPEALLAELQRSLF